MGRRGRGLAGRFRRAMDDESDRERREAEESQRALERAAKARSALFDDLVSFAEETGFLRAKLRDGGLVRVHRKRELRFVPVGDGDAVELDWEGRDPEETHRMYLEQRLGEAWVWGRKRRMRQREDRDLFWDKGLEELLVLGWGLPRPDDDVAVESDFEDDEDDGGPRGRSL